MLVSEKNSPGLKSINASITSVQSTQQSFAIQLNDILNRLKELEVKNKQLSDQLDSILNN
jgi:hypothetical protein